MKKIIIFFAIVIIILVIIGVQYYSYKAEYNAVLQDNNAFEEYENKEIYGIELGTLMNRAIDRNTKNEIEKDEKGNFKQNDTNSIEIEIYISDNDTTYKMETIYAQGTEQFIQYYSDIKFKCSKTEYHKKTGRIKYMLFEQISS